MKIVVTGATGFLGRHLMPVLMRRYAGAQIVGLSSRDYDFMDSAEVQRMFSDHKPEVLVHLAAYSGGIAANRAYPADFFYRNIMLTAPVFHAATEFRVRKMIFPMGGCSYPAGATSPISEDQMWNGFPQPDSAGYSIAKKTGIVASVSYRMQYGLNSVVIVPGNMYGEYDNFGMEDAHVIPALIRRFLEARLAGAKEIIVWGSGRQARDFVYAGDIAETIPYFIDSYDSSEIVNLSSGVSTTIMELAETIRKLTGFQGRIVWDLTKPEGQLVKIFDVSRMKGLGLSCSTSLREGLQKTISWFERNYHSRGDGLRL